MSSEAPEGGGRVVPSPFQGVKLFFAVSKAALGLLGEACPLLWGH